MAMEEASSSKSSSSQICGQKVENAFPTPSKVDPQSNPQPSAVPTSFLDRVRAHSTPPEILSDHLRDRSLTDHGSLSKASYMGIALSRKRSQFYGEAFAVREPNHSAKERVARDSLIMADFRTNVSMVSAAGRDFVVDFSFRLSEIYQRPTTCILVIVAPPTAIMVANSSEPAYYLTITALPSEIAATKNKRCAGLIQEFLEEALQIAPRRGVVRFEAVQEEDLATNGLTTLQEIQQLERGTPDGTVRTLSRQKSRRAKKSIFGTITDRRKDMMTFDSGTQSPTEHEPSSNPPESQRKKLSRRLSIMALFKK